MRRAGCSRRRSAWFWVNVLQPPLASQGTPPLLLTSPHLHLPLFVFLAATKHKQLHMHSHHSDRVFRCECLPPSLICKENHRTSTKLSTLYALYMSHLFYTHVPKYFLFWLQPGLFSRLSEKRASVPGESARGKKRRQSKERGGGEKIADSSKFGN